MTFSLKSHGCQLIGTRGDEPMNVKKQKKKPHHIKLLCSWYSWDIWVWIKVIDRLIGVAIITARSSDVRELTALGSHLILHIMWTLLFLSSMQQFSKRWDDKVWSYIFWVSFFGKRSSRTPTAACFAPTGPQIEYMSLSTTDRTCLSSCEISAARRKFSFLRKR